MDEALKLLLERVKEYNETLSLRINEEIMMLETRAQSKHRVLERKLTELNGLKGDSKSYYVIWDKEANTWLSPKYFCVNQNGEVTNMFRGEVLPSQESFEIFYISDIDRATLKEIMGYSRMGKALEKIMEDYDVLGLGVRSENSLFNKIRWKKSI